jgi:hypothetical protein
MVTAYEEVVLGGPRPMRAGGRVICMPANVTLEQTLLPIITMLRERADDVHRVQSHAFIFGTWARAFPC